ncbi:hypothetical protein [Psychrobacter sp. KCTC 72983]|uniref:hypothetical protein n=1 Tax=Psychrobacter sp. KCTC 72983 TaxID=2733866 RepID=UPI001644D51D|nr:hypothetical protein [Psychrobacter sp. KCTC 72983]
MAAHKNDVMLAYLGCLLASLSSTSIDRYLVTPLKNCVFLNDADWIKVAHHTGITSF